MIFVHYVYKGTIVDTQTLKETFVIDCETEIHTRIKSGVIKRPENYERVIIKDYKINELYVG
ncbi:MAG: hypothetical protein DRG78_04470 [Epsilonproteobacteria bacterium]|nr:MAG: hypothetical protein DRG78_04470 [Campylobacterota bacterium]